MLVGGNCGVYEGTVVKRLAVLGTGIVFGALEAGATAMQRDAGVPSVVVSIVEASVILIMVAAGRTRINSGGGPAA